jgi:hypothetical protein
MVAEYGGPVKDYQTAGIVQERFPVIGTKEFLFSYSFGSKCAFT